MSNFIAEVKHKTMSSKFTTVFEVGRYLMNWDKYNLDYLPEGLGNKFFSARQAAEMIPDGITISLSGFVGAARLSIFYWAIRDTFKRTGHPCNLTMVSPSPHGGRGKVPGTIEELDLPGIINRYIVGHGESAKSILKLAHEGHVELHTISQGVLAFLIEAQANGSDKIITNVGCGTFIDPRCGSGTAVTPNAKDNFVCVVDEMLEYSIPKIDICMFLAPYADKEGNLYLTDAPVILEYVNAARAARRNGGKVFVTVAKIIPHDSSKISIHSDMVDVIIVYPLCIQVGLFFQAEPKFYFLPGEDKIDDTAVRNLKFINNLMKITPKRSEVDNVIARTCANIFAKNTKPGAFVNIGIGLGEEVAHMLYKSGIYKKITFTTESGVYGGIPASGIFFGTSVNPKKIIPSVDMFHLYKKRLDTAILGFLQIDSEGNVNVSHRGSTALEFVGPGGFTDIVTYAKTIIFVGNWMDKAEYICQNGKIIMKKPGRQKIIDKVDKVTFNAKLALRDGKQIYYVTTIGVLKLTENGLELIQVMPGIDIQKDIIETSSARIIISDHLQVIPTEIITGKGFSISFG